MSYWSIDEFLAEEEPVNFSFLEDAPGMSFVDRTKSLDEIVSADQPLEAPLWLVATLHNYLVNTNQENQQIVKVKIPPYLNSENLMNQMAQFKQDPRATTQYINLRQKSVFFYEIYPNIISMTGDYAKINKIQMAKFLKDRGSKIIYRVSKESLKEKYQNILKNYTDSQIDIYHMTKERTRQYNNWRQKKVQ